LNRNYITNTIAEPTASIAKIAIPPHSNLLPVEVGVGATLILDIDKLPAAFETVAEDETPIVEAITADDIKLEVASTFLAEQSAVPEQSGPVIGSGRDVAVVNGFGDVVIGSSAAALTRGESRMATKTIERTQIVRKRNMVY